MVKKKAATKKKSESKTEVSKQPASQAEETSPSAVKDTSDGEEKESTSRSNVGFPIVGIGASAGGLEAIETFFKHMDPESGMAFVLVQHLDPTHKSILSELVGRFARMPVQEASQAVEIQPNHVYVIPANRDLAILNNRLQLLDPTGPRHLRLSIDYFFRSLAQEAGDRAVGIVLSGTGTDGTLGLRAIKGEGGLALVQDPMSAAYDGMPRSAIATGLADAILPPDEMARQLIAYSQNATVPARGVPPSIPRESADDRERLFVLLRSQTGHDFSQYKEATITRRILRRMTINGIETESDYVRFLQQSPAEVDAVWKEFLIRVTQFFRDPAAFELLSDTVIPDLIKSKNIDEPIRIWVPACSTGEEAYSVAMLMREHMEVLGKKLNVQIFATDIDQEALDMARAGIYPESIASDVSTERLRRFFSKVENTYVVGKELRSLLVFSSHDVIKDPPFSRMDVISCRNLLIYMNPELQARVLGLFHYALNSDGFLLLGNSETTSAVDGLFAEFNRKLRLFQRKSGVVAGSPRLPYAGFSQTMGLSGIAKVVKRREKTPSLREATELALLDLYSPTCVVVDDSGNMLYVHGHTGRYLEATTGEASLNVIQLARKELRLPLSAALREANARKQESCYRGLRLDDGNDSLSVDIRVRPLPGLASPHPGFLVLFEDSVAKAQPPDDVIEQATDQVLVDRITMLEQELASTREVLQTANEELQTSNEELGSTVEELQSTNEELLTSQEELRSVNEELLTVNAELESKVEELAEANADKENLLASTETGTLFLDLELQVKWFSPAISKVFNLIEGDVGRPVVHISHHLVDVDLPALVDQVLDTLSPVDQEVCDDKETWYDLRITLYRGENHAVLGTVVSLTDISERKRAKRLELFQALVESAPDATVIANAEGEIIMINSKAEELFGWTRGELAGRPVEVLMPERHRTHHRHYRAGFLENPQARVMAANRILTCMSKDGSEFFGQIALSPLDTEEGMLISSAIRDVTTQMQTELGLQRTNGIYRSMCRWDEAQFDGSPNGGQALEDLCRTLVTESGYSQCWIQFTSVGENRDSGLTAQAGIPDFDASNLHPVLREISTKNESSVIRHIQTDPAHRSLKPVSKDWGFESLACIPLVDGSRSLGVLVVHSGEPDAFDEMELDLLRTMTRRLSQWCVDNGDTSSVPAENQ